MKRLLGYTIAILLISCRKEDIRQETVLQEDVSCSFKFPANMRPNMKQDKLGEIKFHQYYKDYPLVYLDFDGHVDTEWGTNSTYSHVGMSTQDIRQVFDLIATYFRDYKIFITTNERYYDKKPANMRQRIVFTSTYIPEEIAGFAYLNSYGNIDAPAYVFSSKLGYNVKFVSVAGAHEIGHTLGLYHQSIVENGVLTAQYNPGSSYEAPIMGMAYYAQYPVWWKGWNNRLQWQDDDAILKSRLQ